MSRNQVPIAATHARVQELEAAVVEAERSEADFVTTLAAAYGRNDLLVMLSLPGLKS